MLITPYQADRFVDSIGVGVHCAYGQTDRADRENVYAVHDWLALVRWLGVRHVRDGVYTTGASGSACLAADQAMAAAGISVTRFVYPSTLQPLLDSALAAPAAVEPYNEQDNAAPETWTSDLATFQPTLFNAIRARWPQTKVLAGSLANHPNYTAAADVSAYADGSSVHLYTPPAQQAEYYSWASSIADWQTMAPGKPVWITEFGFPTGSPHDPHVFAGDDRAAAILIPRSLLYYFAAASDPTVMALPFPDGRHGFGAERSYMYELLDQHDSPYRLRDPLTAQSGQEDRFGLFTATGRPKAPARTIRNLITLLGDRGPAFSPTPLDVTLTATANLVSWCVFQQRDGTYWIAAWRFNAPTAYAQGHAPEPGPYGGTTRPDTGAAGTFTTAAAFPYVSLYRPLLSDQPLATSRNTGTMAISARFDVQLIRLSTSSPPAISRTAASRIRPR